MMHIWKVILVSAWLLVSLQGTLSFPTSQPISSKSLFETYAVDEATASAFHERLQKGLAKMDLIMTPNFFDSSPVLKPFYENIKKNIEIRESTIPGAGLGLFAKKAMKANTIVSFYPAHALGVDNDITGFISLQESDVKYFAKNPSNKSSYLHCTDQPIFERKSLLDDLVEEPIYLDVNPNREVVDGWVSQMINDGATVMKNSEEGVLKYYDLSKKAKNCIHIPFGPSPIMATATTKKVKKGEELFTSYGGTYWLGVWLDIHGEEGIEISNEIQKEIRETAKDLLKSMKGISLVYSNQIEALQEAFDRI